MSDGPEKTILGAEQKAWLFKTLGASTAKFKLVFSPTPIVGPDRSGKKDNHANTIFAHEGEQLRRKFSSVDGVIVLCGDRHWQYASEDTETGLWSLVVGQVVKSISWVGRKVMSDPRIVSFVLLVDFCLGISIPKARQVR